MHTVGRQELVLEPKSSLGCVEDSQTKVGILELVAVAGEMAE